MLCVQCTVVIYVFVYSFMNLFGYNYSSMSQKCKNVCEKSFCKDA